MPDLAAQKVLIIEDDLAVAESIIFVLENNDYKATHAQNSQEANDRLGETTFDCALLDVWLGAEDGLAFLSKQRAEGSTLPYIVISGGGQGRSLENVTARADAHGAVAMLYKPFSDTELLSALGRALATDT